MAQDVTDHRAEQGAPRMTAAVADDDQVARLALRGRDELVAGIADRDLGLAEENAGVSYNDLTDGTVDAVSGKPLPIAGAIVGMFGASVYLLGLPGGWIADRFLGQRFQQVEEYEGVVSWGVVVVAAGFALWSGGRCVAARYWEIAP